MNCFYLKGTAANSLTTSDAPTAMSAPDMKAAAFVTTLGAEAFKLDVGSVTNGGFPLLAWEKVE